MADPKIFLTKIKNDEGPYDNDPKDAGKETVWGISRVEDPEWEGWPVVDNYRQLPNFPENLRNPEIDALVDKFYIKKYLTPIRYMEINDQDEADSLANDYVNRYSVAIKTQQESIGVPQTGVMDDATINALNS